MHESAHCAIDSAQSLAKSECFRNSGVNGWANRAALCVLARTLEVKDAGRGTAEEARGELPLSGQTKLVGLP